MGRDKKCKNFRQADSRWGRKTYPSRPYYMTGSGCGPTACADLIVTNPKYKKLTPTKTRNYMVKHGYAVRGQGTAWAGIGACLKAYGFKVQQHSSVSSFFKEMKKPGRKAIILFRGGSRGGVCWTLGGHFVACSGMTIKNKKHYLYTLDPGPRHNDGWHAYETTMKGLVLQLWTCYLPSTKKTTKKTTKKATKKTTKKTTTKKTTSTGLTAVAAYAKKRAKEKHAYKVGGRSWKTAVDCHSFTSLCFEDCGYKTIAKKIRKNGAHKKFYTKDYLGDYVVQHNSKGVNVKKLLVGDIVYRRNKTMPGYHSAIYVGNGKIAEAVKKGTRVSKITKAFTYAVRIPASAKDKPKAKTKTVVHRATYTVVTKKGLNIRKNYTAKSAKIGVIEPGKIFRATKKHGNWIYGTYGSKKGWVCIKKDNKTYMKKK